ncbi:MAG: hypothetical protein KatS3mg016_0935 [Fimbriimonadales bacterium]|nr:MAG: hypothetical protein KatS3mg016_0935 [Fimbriimonadales bacterium]
MHRGRKTCRIRGSMMLEVAVASVLSLIILMLLVNTQLSVLRCYERTIDHNTANRSTYNALREVREIVQQATSVSVSGASAAILLPRRDGNGRFITPLQADTANPVQLQVNFSLGQLRLTQNGQTRVLLTNLVNRTPQGVSYTPFSVQQIAPGVTAFHIRLSVQQGQDTNAPYLWYEETILLRNAVQN